MTTHLMQYMIILFILFLIQFALACACLALSSPQQRHVLRLGWSRASNELKFQMQMHFSCCSFDNSTMNLAADDPGNMGHPPCKEVQHCDSYSCCSFCKIVFKINFCFILLLYLVFACYYVITLLALLVFCFFRAR